MIFSASLDGSGSAREKVRCDGPLIVLAFFDLIG
jgi:hypothetical protein